MKKIFYGLLILVGFYFSACSDKEYAASTTTSSSSLIPEISADCAGSECL